MRYIKYFFFSFLNIILRLEIAFSYFERGIKLTENITDEPTTVISTNLDMGICSCDLTNHCDYRCCCDNDCNNEDKKKWEEDDICLNYNKDRIEDFKCKNKKENFEFNKNKAGLSVKDHIHNIMCVQIDNSGDMGNFYLNENNEEREELEIWKDKFFQNNIAKNEQSCQYGDITNHHIYKADSNGNCIKQNIHCLIPYETSCISKDIDELQNISFYDHTINYSINTNGKNITFIDAPKNTTKNTSILKKFKVQWESSNQTSKDLPDGYIQGNPIKITIENSNTVNANGFFIGMSNRRGFCAKEFSEVSNPTPISFKRNAMFSCRLDSDLQSTYIYKNFINQKLIIGKSISSTSVVTLGKLADSDNSIFNNTNNTNNDNDILMYLIIFTTKSGKENSPYEYIEHAKLKAKKKPSQSKRPILSLIVKYVEFSYSSISNSKEEKPTSLIPFSEEILNELSGKSEKK